MPSVVVVVVTDLADRPPSNGQAFARSMIATKAELEERERRLSLWHETFTPGSKDAGVSSKANPVY